MLLSGLPCCSTPVKPWFSLLEECVDRAGEVFGEGADPEALALGVELGLE
jgi:hypothetical protein